MDTDRRKWKWGQHNKRFEQEVAEETENCRNAGHADYFDHGWTRMDTECEPVAAPLATGDLGQEDGESRMDQSEPLGTQRSTLNLKPAKGRKH